MMSASRARKPVPSLLWWAASFLVICAATVGLLWWRDGRDRKVPAPPSPPDVVERIKDERLLPARLSGGFRYAPYDPQAERDPVLERQAKQAHSPARIYRGSPAQLESLNTETWLALVDPGQWRQALLSLEAAKASSPQSAAVWSDLAAVQYSLAREQGEPIDFLPALDAAEQAFLLDPHMPEALFNRALCLEALGLWQAAKTTWEAYLEEDASSGWADEARQHLQALRIPAPADWPKARLREVALSGDLTAVQEIVRGDRSPSRRLLEEEILPDWGVAVLAGEPEQDEAAALLRAARAIATAYEELTGDSLYREAVEAIEGAGNERLAELAAAHRDFGAAVQAIDRGEEIDRAADLLDAALPLFGASPFLWRAELKRAIAEQRKDKYAAALQRLRRLQEGIREARYLNLSGEAFWVEGMTHKYQDHLVPAGEAYDRALPFFETAGEIDLSAGIYNLQAELLDAVGQGGEVWRRLRKALSAAPEILLERRLYQIYSTGAISAWVAGYPRVGLLFWDELQSWATTNPQHPVDSSLWRARLLHELGSEPEAVQALAQARDELEKVTTEESRDSLEAEIRVVEAEMAVAEDPAAAVASLRATLKSYTDTDKKVWDKTVHLQLGRALRQLGDAAAAREAFAASLDRTEIQRRQLDKDDRASLLRVDGEAFEQLVDLDFAAGNHRQALAWSEQQRARTLLDRFVEPASGEGAAVRPIEEIRRQLPPDLTLIEYAEVRGRWLAWVISSREVRGIDLQIGDDDLLRRVQRWVADIQREVPPEELRKDAAELYRALILPLQLPAGGDWVIVPDGVLKDLPWAALFDGERFLIERHPLATAPSANFFLRAEQRNRRLPATQPLRALVLGNPAFDRQKFPALDDLPEAAAEAAAVGDLYAARPFLGQAATKARFLEGVPASEIVQFSGHAQTRPESPLDSALLLAGGVLSAQEIRSLRLDRTRLMILSACSTASGPSQGGEGAESLAVAFLAAGVPGVVATLWNVEDQPTSELVIEFHRRLQQEGDARRALQQAQLQFLDRPVAAWAAFQLIGDASFDDSQP
jgi:CHAT domain-containing protein